MLNQMQLIFLLLRHQEKVKNSVDTCKVKTSVNEPSWIAGFIPVKYGCRCCFGNAVLYWKVHGLHDSPQGNTWNNVAYLFSSAKDLSRKHPVISRNKKQFEKRIVYFLFRLSLSRNLTTFVCVCFSLKGYDMHLTWDTAMALALTFLDGAPPLSRGMGQWQPKRKTNS